MQDLSQCERNDDRWLVIVADLGGGGGSGGGDRGNNGSGGGPRGPGGPRRPGGEQQIPEIDEIVRKGQEQLRVLMGGRGGRVWRRW